MMMVSFGVSSGTALKNFRQVLAGINVRPLLTQLEQNPNLWSTETEWTRKDVPEPLRPYFVLYETENIVLRYNEPRLPEDRSWNRPALQALSAAKRIILDLMSAIPGEHLGKIVITRMKSGETIKPHTDMLPPGWPVYWQRFQIPLQVESGVRFVCDEEELYMRPGTAWWFNNQIQHAVYNDSKTDRISMLADIKPWA
jgi:hypothetical protein